MSFVDLISRPTHQTIANPIALGKTSIVPLNEVQSDAVYFHFADAVPVFNNAGVFRKTGGTNATAIQRVVFNNTGKVEVQKGTLSFPTGLTSSATMDVSGGAILDLSGGPVALKTGADFTGAGFYGVTGSVEVNGTIAAQNFQVTGTLVGTNTINGRINWTSGAINSQLTISAGSVLEISSDNQKSNFGNTINNAGTVRWSGSGNWQANAGAVFNNQAGGVFEVQNDAVYFHFADAVPVFNNAGVFRKTGGTNATTIQRVVFNNTGTVELRSGILSFSEDYTQSGGAMILAGGTLTATSVININGGTLEGTGTVNANVFNRAQVNPSALTVNGNYTQTATGALNLKIGGLLPGIQFDTLAINGRAALDGSLNVTLTNAFQPRAGNSFLVMSYSSRNGTFAKTNGLDLAGGLKLSFNLSPTSLILSLPSPFTLSRTTDGLFKIHYEGTAGVLYRLEASADLVNWVLLTPNSLVGVIDLTDPASASLPRRFYRVRTP